VWVTGDLCVTEQGSVSRQFRVTRVSDLLARKEHIPSPTLSGMTEIRDDEEGIGCATNKEGE
jgi:hypothetical protein